MVKSRLLFLFPYALDSTEVALSEVGPHVKNCKDISAAECVAQCYLYDFFAKDISASKYLIRIFLEGTTVNTSKLHPDSC